MSPPFQRGPAGRLRPGLKLLRFAPVQVGYDGDARDAWFKQHVPAGLSGSSILLPLHAEAERLNRQYRRTIEAVRQAVEAGRLNPKQASHLLHMLARDGAVAMAWRDAGCPCPMAELRAAEKKASKLLQDVRDTAGRLAVLLEAGEPSDSLHFGISSAARHTEQVFDAHVLWPRKEDGGVPTVGALAFFMREIARRMPDGPRYRVGPMRHHFQYGPLLLASAFVGKRTRLPDWETLVLFGARMVARIATGSPRARGGTPRGGSPLHPIAMAFLADLSSNKRLPISKSAKAVERLEAEGHAWRGWQSLRSDLAEKGVILG